jgi:hypothetical protein
MRPGSRQTTDADICPDPSDSLLQHPVWFALATATAGAWLGLVVSVLGWFDEPLTVWFQVSTVAIAIGACGGLGIAAVVTAVRIQHRRTDQQQVEIAEF